MFLHIIHEPRDHAPRHEERGHETDRERDPLRRGQVRPAFHELQERSPEHRRDRQEEREFGGAGAGAAQAHRTEDRHGRPRSPGDHGEALEETDRKRLAVAHLHDLRRA